MKKAAAATVLYSLAGLVGVVLAPRAGSLTFAVLIVLAVDLTAALGIGRWLDSAPHGLWKAAAAVCLGTWACVGLLLAALTRWPTALGDGLALILLLAVHVLAAAPAAGLASVMARARPAQPSG